MNYDLPDHPVIQNMERTGYPDGRSRPSRFARLW